MLANNGDWEPSVADTDQQGVVEIGGIAQSAEAGLLDSVILVSEAVWEPIGETGEAELVSWDRVIFQVHVGPLDGLREPRGHGHVDAGCLQPR